MHFRQMTMKILLILHYYFHYLLISIGFCTQTTHLQRSIDVNIMRPLLHACHSGFVAQQFPLFCGGTYLQVRPGFIKSHGDTRLFCCWFDISV